MADEEMDYGFLLENLMENSMDSIYFKDLQSRFVMGNQTCADKHGCDSPAAIVGKSDFDTFSREHAEKAYADEQHIIETGEPLFGIEEKETRPGRQEETWASTTKVPLRDEAGNIIGTFGISRDITEHKQAELRTKRYVEEIQNIKEEMEEDVRMAGELQKGFFPSSYPAFPEDARPEEHCVEFLHRANLCRVVSGDYCAVTRLSGHEAGIFLCDVAGTGIRAALGTALVRGIMQETAMLRLDPGAYLSRMNDLLVPLLKQEGFKLEVTACYLVLDVATGRIRLASANHPLPIHFHDGHAAKWLFEDLSLRGPALASQSGAVYPTIECQIDPDDSVVLFTDGLFTVKNALDDRFGKKRLIGSAHSFVGESLEDIFCGLEGDALAFSKDGRFSADVCMVGFHLRRLLRRDE